MRESAIVNWRAQHSVLVTEAQTVGALAVIRSLGSAGYPVIACSPARNALGFRSRFARHALIHCPYDDAAFMPWLRETIGRHNIKAIVPSEGFLLAVRPAFAEFRHLLPLNRDEGVVYAGMSKYDLFSAFEAPDAPAAVRAHLPPYCLIDENDPLPTDATLLALGDPLYAKTDGSYARQGVSGVVKKVPHTRARAELEALREIYRRLIVQGHVAGQGAGVFLLRHQGRILARFMHLRLHEVPHTGGVSSLRKRWWHPGMVADAMRRMEFLDWEGVAMFEYRWNPDSDEFHLMEMNGRFWGSLHLALYAGVDFPRLLLDAFFGQPERKALSRRDVVSRLTFPLEVDYLVSRLRDSTLPTGARLWSLWEWFALGLDPKVKADLWFPGDPRPYWSALAHTTGRFVRLAWRRSPLAAVWGKRRRIAKLSFFHACKATGLFYLSSLLYRRYLHILCYHGISFTDEHRFRPGLFMRAELFARRLAWLKRRGYTILSLQDGLARLRAGTLDRKIAVLTIDDGFYGTGQLAAPLLKQYGFPATLYVTTYYVQHPNPIFRLAVQYMYWKTELSDFDARDLIPDVDGRQPTRGAVAEALMHRIIEHGETHCSEEGRVALAAELGRRLSVDYAELQASRRLSLLTEDEVRYLRAQGIDVQLHTHRHRLPLDTDELARELRENRAVLEPLTGERLVHLCYPSGIYTQTQWGDLRAAGIESATTCEIGPNSPTAPALGLRRMLDREELARIELEAELTGFSDLLRRARALLTRGSNSTPGNTQVVTRPRKSTAETSQ